MIVGVVFAAESTPEELDFFEKNVRPVLVEHCQSCHGNKKQQAGLRLLQRNYRTPGRGGGEIDLIMRSPDQTVVFIEVRCRVSDLYGGAGASINATKRRRIVRAAQYFLCRLRYIPACRFDVVLIGPAGVQWLVAAFDAAG